MKPRHAASLALVGWYLMIPPGKEFMAPLEYWVQEGSFDTAKECAAGQVDYSNEYGHMDTNDARWKEWESWYYKKFGDHPSRKDTAQILRVGAEQSQCIASDDPRLKGK